MGFKEDIIVSRYTGQTEFEFVLETNGLTLHNENGSYVLKDSTGVIKAALGEIIIFTADEMNNTTGIMTAETVKAGEQYMLTIEIDASWLADEKTKYPIVIDPTVSIKERI